MLSTSSNALWTLVFLSWGILGRGNHPARPWALARLLLSPAGDSGATGVTGGFLLLDEPTNHLDAQAKEWLTGWLRAYSGTVLLVSHDEALLENGVDRLVEVRAGKLHAYKGNYTKFMEERSMRRKVAQSAAGPHNLCRSKRCQMCG